MTEAPLEYQLWYSHKTLNPKHVYHFALELSENSQRFSNFSDSCILKFEEVILKLKLVKENY